jgi:hypothetical protein
MFQLWNKTSFKKKTLDMYSNTQELSKNSDTW